MVGPSFSIHFGELRSRLLIESVQPPIHNVLQDRAEGRYRLDGSSFYEDEPPSTANIEEGK